MEQATLLIQKHNLHGFQLLRQLTRSDIRIDIQDLAVCTLRQTRQDGQGTSSDGRLDGPFVDLGDLADKTVLVLVEVVGGEDARGDGACTGPELFECCDELEVLFEEDAAGDLEGLCVCSCSY